MRVRSVVVLCDTVGRNGGTESYLERILPEFARQGVKLTVAARRVHDGAFGIRARTIEWATEDAEPDRDAAAAVRRTIRDARPDAVLVSNVFDAGVLDAARSAERLVVRIHDHRAFCPNGDRRFPQFPSNCTARMGGACVGNAFVHGCVAGPHAQTYARLMARMRVRDVLGRADSFVVSSQFMARTCERNGIDPARIAVAPPPVSSEDFASAPTPMPSQRRVLFAGRIVPQKGLISLVRAVAKISTDRRPVLAVAGEATAELERAQALASRIGVRLEPLGRLDPAQMRAAIDAARAVAVPSLWDEPFGLVGIEAQVRARPAVAYAVGGIPEWLGEAGIAVPAGDETALARALDDVIDESNWTHYAAEAYSRSKMFHLDNHIGKLDEVLCAS